MPNILPPQLDYRPKPPLVGTVHFRRWLTRGILVLAVLSPLYWGSSLWRNLRAVYWQRQCMAYVAPAGQVVCDADLMGGRVNTQSSVPGWDHFAPLIRFNDDWKPGAPLLFVGQRSNAKLVAVEFLSHSPDGTVNFRVWHPRLGTLAEPPGRGYGLWTLQLHELDRAKRLRFFAGQPDQSDPSRFTMGYDVDGQTGVIDGRVNADGHVDLVVLKSP